MYIQQAPKIQSSINENKIVKHNFLSFSYHPFINPIVNPADILPVSGIPKLVIANEEAVAAAVPSFYAPHNWPYPEGNLCHERYRNLKLTLHHNGNLPSYEFDNPSIW